MEEILDYLKVDGFTNLDLGKEAGNPYWEAVEGKEDEEEKFIKEIEQGNQKVRKGFL